MKTSLYFLFFSVFLFTSCKEDEVPQSFLTGTYENAGLNTETGISYVSQYTFQAGGTYERISLLREDGQLLGYNFHSKGTYSLRGEEFIAQDGQMAGILDYEENPDGYVENLELLDDYMTETMERKGNLRQLEGGEKIAILMECNDIVGYSAMCMGEQVYVQVD